MSDIPHARQILEQLLKDLENFDSDIMQTRAAVKSALKHMYKGQRQSLPASLKGKSKREIEHIIESNKTPKGGWTRDTLQMWGINWPPPKGWKNDLIESGTDDKPS
jgi:hypothetical protein